MLKKIILFLTLVLLQITSSSAVELSITNNISNIFNSKKICIRISLSPEDQAIYSNSVSFSVDSPEIAITSWECKQNPTMQYVTKFKRIKKLYTQPLTCEINLNFESNTNEKSDVKKTIIEHLRESSLYASCLVLNKNGTSHPVSLVKNLDDGFSLLDTLAYNNTLSYDSIKTLTQNHLNDKNLTTTNQLYKKLGKPKKPVPEFANILIDNLKIISTTLITKIQSLFSLFNYIFLYLLIFILILLLFLKKLRPENIWLIELRRFLIICWILSSYSFLNSVIPSYIFLTGFAVLIAPIAMYYIFTAKTESTLDKLKSFIGFALAMTTLPLLIKAYLSFMFY